MRVVVDVCGLLFLNKRFMCDACYVLLLFVVCCLVLLVFFLVCGAWC